MNDRAIPTDAEISELERALRNDEYVTFEHDRLRRLIAIYRTARDSDGPTVWPPA